MTPAQLKAWRTRLGITQRAAAAKLGIGFSTLQGYEKGERSGEPVRIPLYIELATNHLKK